MVVHYSLINARHLHVRVYSCVSSPMEHRSRARASHVCPGTVCWPDYSRANCRSTRPKPRANVRTRQLRQAGCVPPASATASTVLLRTVSLFYQRWHAATGYPTTRPPGARHAIMATGSDCAADAHASGTGVATVCAGRLCA